jgi:hypothetical protein
MHEWSPDRPYSYHCFIQEMFPVREFRYGGGNSPTEVWTAWQHCTAEKADRKIDPNISFVVRNIPPIEKEECMPSEWESRAGLIEVPVDRTYTDSKAWLGYSLGKNEELRDIARHGGVKQKATKLIAGAKTDGEKLQRLYDFCQKEIGNLNFADTAEAKVIRGKRSDAYDQWPMDTMESRMGNPRQINYLFLVMARAAGFEVKCAQSANRAKVFSVKTEMGWAFLDRMSVAIRVDGGWRFFSPGNYWVPYGMLDWRDEGVTALLCDNDQVLFETTPLSSSDQSQAKRKGRFTLDAEGSLDGEIEETFSGHEGIAVKSQNAGRADDEVDRDFRAMLVKRLPTAVVSDLRWENLRNQDFPVTVRYKVHVPRYAEQAGKRLIVAPGYFETGKPATFTAETRKYPIFFPFAREEHDDIEIVLPVGFELDHPSSPANVAADQKTIGARYQMGYKPKHRILLYQRDFILGGNQAISFQVESYPVLKQRFALMHQSDTHTLILAPKAANNEDPGVASPATRPAGEVNANPAGS